MAKEIFDAVSCKTTKMNIKKRWRSGGSSSVETKWIRALLVKPRAFKHSPLVLIESIFS